MAKITIIDLIRREGREPGGKCRKGTQVLPVIGAWYDKKASVVLPAGTYRVEWRSTVGDVSSPEIKTVRLTGRKLHAVTFKKDGRIRVT